MQRFFPNKFLLLGRYLTQCQTRAESVAVYPPQLAPKDMIGLLEEVANHVIDYASELGLDVSATDVANRIRETIKETGSSLTQPQFDTMAQQLFWHVRASAKRRVYLHIPPEAAKYFEDQTLFSDRAKQRFPKATRELIEAGNCYAMDRFTACVFHSMRAAEKGLHALAKKLGVKFPYPIELSDWANVIDACESKVNAMRALPKGKAKASTLTFYSRCAAEFRYFKDAWRNHVMHGREIYDELLARRIMMHVRDFIEELSGRLKE